MNYTDWMFFLSRISVVLASLIIVTAGIVWLINVIKNHRMDIPRQNNVMLIKLSEGIAELINTHAEANRLHQQELDHRVDLMQTLHHLVKEVKANGEQLANYGRRCDDAHRLLDRFMEMRKS